MKPQDKPCFCSSGNPYKVCCFPFHRGAAYPKTALQLMRSRFSAYALNIPDYIIQTTHPASPDYKEDISSWKKGIAAFARDTVFQKLEILEFSEHGTVAIVSFIAHLSQKKEDVTFTEKSFFENFKGKWYYRVGHLVEGKAPTIVTGKQLKLLPLAYYGDPILRKVGAPVKEISEDLCRLISDMIETMDACDGLGLAAPQVHHSIQLFVIRDPIEDEKGKVELGEARVFINPKILKKSEETWKMGEGCLSIPTIHADVDRPKKITVEYTDLDGKRVVEECSGWKAKVILHENDHLQGVLFIDHLTEKEKEQIEPFLKRLHKRIHDGTEM